MSEDKLLNKIVILNEPMYAYKHVDFQSSGQGGRPTLLPRGTAIIVKHNSSRYESWRLFIYKREYWITEQVAISRCLGTILPNTKTSRTLYLTET